MTGILGTGRNWPEFDLRWNRGYSCSGLHTGTRNSTRFGWNGTEFIKLLKIPKCLIHANDCGSMPTIFTVHFSPIFFCPFKYEMCCSTRSSLHTISFNLTNGYFFTGDVELVNLSNLEVLNLGRNRLNGSLPFKGKHSYHLF